MERLSPHPAAHCIRVDPPPPGEGKERPRLRDLAECFFREVFIYSRPLRIEGAGNAGRPMRPRSRVQDVVESAHEHTGHTGITRHSPRNGFNGYIVLSPVLRACWPPSPALLLADLTPASGCQDHTTSHVRQTALLVLKRSLRPPHPAPR